MTPEKYWEDNHSKIVNGQFMSSIRFFAFAKQYEKQVCKKQREICADIVDKSRQPIPFQQIPYVEERVYQRNRDLAEIANKVENAPSPLEEKL